MMVFISEPQNAFQMRSGLLSVRGTLASGQLYHSLAWQRDGEASSQSICITTHWCMLQPPQKPPEPEQPEQQEEEITLLPSPVKDS